VVGSTKLATPACSHWMEILLWGENDKMILLTLLNTGFFWFFFFFGVMPSRLDHGLFNHIAESERSVDLNFASTLGVMIRRPLSE